MVTDRNDDAVLAEFFAAGRAEDGPDPALAARLLGDARALAVRPAPSPRRRLAWASVLGLLGGWPSMAGMTAAAAAGVFVGFSSPDLVDDFLGEDPAYVLDDMLPDLAELAGGDEQ